MKVQTVGAITVLGAALVVSGCATNQQAGMYDGEGRSHGHMSQMCEMHKQMTEGKSPAEQRAAIEEHVKSMHGSASPEMVAHHTKMMEMHCSGADAPARE